MSTFWCFKKSIEQPYKNCCFFYRCLKKGLSPFWSKLTPRQANKPKLRYVKHGGFYLSNFEHVLFLHRSIWLILNKATVRLCVSPTVGTLLYKLAYCQNKLAVFVNSCLPYRFRGVEVSLTTMIICDLRSFASECMMGW